MLLYLTSSITSLPAQVPRSVWLGNTFIPLLVTVLRYFPSFNFLLKEVVEFVLSMPQALLPSTTKQ